jgi:hypothetical protein
MMKRGKGFGVKIDLECLISCHYGKEISHIFESKTGKEKTDSEESCQTRERREPRKRTQVSGKGVCCQAAK